WFTPEELPDNKYYIFGRDGVQSLANELSVEVLGQIPLVQSIREAGDAGRPAVLQKTTPQAIAFKDLAQKVLQLKPVKLDPVTT
ncbi:MAG: Mrp/NBP35 family ATP-binding protein, partial [Flavobacteriales bacterium]|nr:Mrp/NBP35 family ATP-binding protein [Flavobacteriales bacterium]